MSEPSESRSLTPPNASGTRQTEPPQPPSNRNDNNYYPMYSLEHIPSDDWEILSWIASIRSWKTYVHLLIVIWDKFDMNPEFNNLEDLENEFNVLKRYIDELYSLHAINKTYRQQFKDLLDNYYHCRVDSNEEERVQLINDSWTYLGEHGLKYSHEFSNQISRLKYSQKRKLRKIVLRRIEWFKDLPYKTNSQNQRNLDNTKALKEEIRHLKDEIGSLNKQNSQYQAALGDVRNVRWNDDDPNNTAKLTEDFQEIQFALSEFTLVQGEDYKINIQTSSNILTHFGCKAEFSSLQAQLVLSAALQRHTIEKVLNIMTSYFKYCTQKETSKDNDETLEVDITNAVEKIISLTEKFSIVRPGEDDATKMTPVKLRQQVYSALGFRGFSNPDHPFIKETSVQLLEGLSHYREVLDEELKSELEEQSVIIVRDIILLFYFRLKVQPVVLMYKFFDSGEDVDARYMQGSWGRDDLKKLEVEICSFPMIGIANEKNEIQKVLTKAHVITRPKVANNSSFISSVKNLITKHG